MISAGAAAIFLGEDVNAVQWIGMAVVLVALAAVIVTDARTGATTANLMETATEPEH